MPVSTKIGGPTRPAPTAAPTSVSLRSGAIEIVAVAIPFLRGHESGDCVGAAGLRDGALAWLIDVEGKGSMAAPLASALHGVASKHAESGEIRLMALLNTMHKICVTFGRSAAVTLFHIMHNRVVVGVAGMRAPVVIEDGRSIATEVEAEGMTIGFPFAPNFELATIELPPGSILLSASDGLYEAEDADGQLFDLQALGNVLKGHGGMSLSSSLVRVLDAVEKHAPVQADDRSVIMIRCGGGPDAPTTAGFLLNQPRVPQCSDETNAYRFLNAAELESCVVCA